MKIVNLHKDLNRDIKQAQKQNRKAQFYIYKRFSPKMLSVCRMYISDVHFAEDVMSKAFVKVFENIQQYKFKGSFEGWIRKIMVTTAIDFLRQKKPISFSTDCIENYEQIEIETVPEDRTEQIQHCIDLLPEGYKLVFNMFVLEGYSHQEIAERLQVSESTSKSQLYKAKRLLKKKIEELEQQDYGEV
ncbi:MAG: RNA polymerase sigma factor [Bacteroidota bacterium]